MSNHQSSSLVLDANDQTPLESVPPISSHPDVDVGEFDVEEASRPVDNRDDDAGPTDGDQVEAESSVGVEGGSQDEIGPFGLERPESIAELAASASPGADAAIAEFAATQEHRTVVRMAAPEVVIGRDDRVRITPATGYPWRTICALRIRAADGTNWIGTGFLVGSRVVITAGHCAFLHDNGGWATEIEVIPGLDGLSRPYGSCRSRRFASVRGWVDGRNSSYDYAAVVLPEDCTYGRRLGFFGYGAYSESTLEQKVVNLSGYPSDKGGSTQWWHARRLVDASDLRLRYNIDTAGGQSGAPIWFINPSGGRRVVGIHTNGHSSGNGGVRITRSVFDNIRQWKQQHH